MPYGLPPFSLLPSPVNAAEGKPNCDLAANYQKPHVGGDADISNPG